MDNILLNTLIIGQKFIYLPKCPSTNLEARTLIETSKPQEGTVIYTDHQTAGRGQMGNTWEAQSQQNLTFSVILQPSSLKIEQQFYLSMSVAIAIQRFLSIYCEQADVKIKWPNDILVQGKKISGTLIENTLQQQQIQYSVVGIGININQQYFSYPNATSLQNATGQSYSLQKLLTEILTLLDQEYHRLQKGFFDVIKNDYIALLFGWRAWRNYEINQKISKARIIDIAPNGQLILEHSNGSRHAYGIKEIGYVFESTTTNL